MENKHSIHIHYGLKYHDKHTFALDMCFLMNELYGGNITYTPIFRRLLQFNKEFYQHDSKLLAKIHKAIADFEHMYIGNTDILYCKKMI